MFGTVILLPLMALLCTGSRDISSSDALMKDEYETRCRNFKSGGEMMGAYFYESNFFCFFSCFGKDDNDDWYFDTHHKTDGLTCSSNFWTKELSRCLNGTCVRDSNIEYCKDELGGKVKALTEEECDLTCTGEDGSVVSTTRKAGDGCTRYDMPWKEGQCSSYDYCEAQTNYMDNEEGVLTKNDIEARQTCQNRHLGDNNPFAFRINWQEDCSYMCYFNETGDYDYEFLDIPDGKDCAGGNQCLGGRCRSSADIGTCENALTGDTLQQIDYRECNMYCLGQDDKEVIPMPVDSDCTKKINEWSSASGKCNANKECEVEDDSKK